ncbi:MAG: hypothetical protein IJS22_02820 [Lachnospiraceae bacterium]|nr:hypothetical protein [Lachnospiraceae bacterium]
MKKLLSVAVAAAMILTAFYTAPVSTMAAGDTDTRMLLTCDMLSGSWGTNLELAAENAKEGSGFIIATDSDCPVICNNTFLKTDISGYEYGGVRFWLYVSNAANVNGDARPKVIQLKTDDTNVFKWDLSGITFADGWNDIYLPFSGAATTADYTNVNMLWLYMYVSGETTIGIDALRVEQEVRDTKSKAIQSFDTLSGTWGTNTVLAETGAQEGSGYVTATDADCPVICNNAFEINDISSYKGGWIRFWLYVSNAANVNGDSRPKTLQIKTDDTNVFNWDLSAITLNDGWNDVRLRFSDATSKADYSNVNMLWLYMYVSGETTIGIDGLRAEDYVQPPVPDKVLSECEEIGPWVGNTPPTLQTEGAPVGNAWLKSASENYPVFAWWCSAIDISKYSENGYLHMWLYVTDASKVVDGFIELSSSGNPDVDEASWALKSLGLSDGWNELYLPFRKAVTVGTVDYSAINFIRIYAGLTEASYIGIDKVELTVNRPPAADRLFSEVEDLNGWTSLDGLTLESENAAVGAKWIRTENNAGWPSIAWWCPATDISDYTDTGYFHIWLNVEDASKIVGGQIELTSSGAPDSDEIAWDLLSVGLIDGWNELYLPFADSVKTGTADTSAINFIRIYAGIAGEGRIGIDKMEFVSEIPVHVPDCEVAFYASVEESISPIFDVKLINENYKEAYLKVRVGSSDEIVYSTEPGEDGIYEFRVEEITAQQMNDIITAKLDVKLADGSFKEAWTLDAHDGFSIAAYCGQVAEGNADKPKLLTLMANMLKYGAAAQAYSGYMTDSPADQAAWVASNAESYEMTEAEKNTYALKINTFAASPDKLLIRSASLELAEIVTLKCSIMLKETEGKVIRFNGGGKNAEIPASSLSLDANGNTEIWLSMMPQDFTETLTLSITNSDGTAVYHSVSYSVFAYLYRMYGKDAGLDALIKSIYDYSRSAIDYFE